MDFKVIHQDAAGLITTTLGSIGYLAFCKHLTFAGVGPIMAPYLASRLLGDICGFNQYWGNNPVSFELPNPFNNDPTETAYVSNRVGRAFADYLSKNIYGAIYTHCYEDAMVANGNPVAGSRPDFYCDDPLNLTRFAVESKGYACATYSENEMNRILPTRGPKLQSTTGPLRKDFSVASVAYNLYAEPTIKFYDPISTSTIYDKNLSQRLRSGYYESILGSINSLGLERDTNIHDQNFVAYKIPIVSCSISKILLHQAIVKREWNNNEWLKEIGKNRKDEKYYIDNDGIGFASY
ncbi:hypothetical protein Ga0123461_2301 [Mariprofundus aestuarium]|uniref:Uncharacterized protein n=1 Tax=Mariprofundus aestuarium TaxID=1921086 RepID=A0A2K8L0V6_MARES|nr:hypothetical protein [Mariprofundus aestuarium]ATX80702.1 hypothetical protein Ga0123461_2301 [Mariprofundus aestuarium]